MIRPDWNDALDADRRRAKEALADTRKVLAEIVEFCGDGDLRQQMRDAADACVWPDDPDSTAPLTRHTRHMLAVGEMYATAARAADRWTDADTGPETADLMRRGARARSLEAEFDIAYREVGR